MKKIVKIFLGLAFIVAISLLVFSGLSYHKIYKENKILKSDNERLNGRLNRFQARYQLGDLENTIKITHTCGNTDLYSLTISQQDQYYIRILEASQCFEHREKNKE
jgi:hypothetical protein